MKRSGSRFAFTLVELLVVIMIILVIAALLLAAMGKVYQSNYKASANSTIRGLYTAIDSYYLQYAKYISSSGDLTESTVLTPLKDAKLFSYKNDDITGGKLMDPWDQPFQFYGDAGTPPGVPPAKWDTLGSVPAAAVTYFTTTTKVSHKVLIFSFGAENATSTKWEKELIICKPDGK